VQLALAKAKTYKLGFYEGKMCIGDYKGASVQVCMHPCMCVCISIKGFRTGNLLEISRI
jgi:hypothetical protein